MERIVEGIEDTREMISVRFLCAEKYLLML